MGYGLTKKVMHLLKVYFFQRHFHLLLPGGQTGNKASLGGHDGQETPSSKKSPH